MWNQPLGAQNTLPVARGTGGQVVHACGALVATGLPVLAEVLRRPSPACACLQHVWNVAGCHRGTLLVPVLLFIIN